MRRSKPESCQYSDSTLSVTVPPYLRQSKTNQMLFERRKKKAEGHSIASVAIVALRHRDHVEALLARIERFKDGTPPNGSPMSAIRRGPTDWLEGGVELFVAIHRLADSVTCYDYRAYVKCGALEIQVNVLGDGDLHLFDETVKSIVRSIRPVAGEASAEPSAPVAISGGGLRRSKRTRLVKAFATLPMELLHLREAILAIADQDQSLLGSGDGDLTVLDECMRKVASSEPIGTRAERDADRLRQWLETVPGSQSSWAGPLWFIEGSLRGMAIWAEED